METVDKLVSYHEDSGSDHEPAWVEHTVHGSLNDPRARTLTHDVTNNLENLQCLEVFSVLVILFFIVKPPSWEKWLGHCCYFSFLSNSFSFITVNIFGNIDLNSLAERGLN